MSARQVQARVDPDGFVAQRFDRDFNGHGNWILTYLTEQGVEIRVLNDDEVASWPQLGIVTDG